MSQTLWLTRTIHDFVRRDSDPVELQRRDSDPVESRRRDQSPVVQGAFCQSRNKTAPGSVSGKALAAGSSQRFSMQTPAASAVPLTSTKSCALSVNASNMALSS